VLLGLLYLKAFPLCRPHSRDQAGDSTYARALTLLLKVTQADFCQRLWDTAKEMCAQPSASGMLAGVHDVCSGACDM